MKNIIIILVTFCSFSLFSQTEKWQIQPTDFTNDLYGIYFTDSLTGYICGENGLILKTTNGINWLQQNTPTTNILRDIFFLRDTLGWACGDSGTIIHTDNGGETWEIQPTNSNRKLNSIAFYDFTIDYRGWAAGDSVLLIKWSKDSTWAGGTNIQPEIFHQVTYQNPTIYETIFLVSDRVLLTTNGNIWTLLWILPYQPLAITKRIDYNILWTERNFWMVGKHGSAYAFQQPAPTAPCYFSITPDTLDLYGVAVDEYADEVWAVGVKGRILLTENEGVSYDLFPSPVIEDLNDICFSGYHTGYIVGDNGIILYYQEDWVVSFKDYMTEMEIFIYPNPFKGNTNICFKLVEDSNISVTIYDFTGKMVKAINSGLLISGNHSVEIYSSNLPSGIYFYALEVNGIRTDTKKMTIIN